MLPGGTNPRSARYYVLAKFLPWAGTHCLPIWLWRVCRYFFQDNPKTSTILKDFGVFNEFLGFIFLLVGARVMAARISGGRV